MTIQPFHIIVAAASNRGIGKAGKIPWRIPEDVRYFKNITCLFRDTHTLNKYEVNLNRIKRQKIEISLEKDKPIYVTDNFPIKFTDNIPPNVVVMGRNTWESIPSKFRPMPNRINVVLSRNKEYLKKLPKDVQCYISLQECLENLSKQEHGTIFLIGGGQIYNEGIKHPNCESIFITKVHGKFDCDTFFPEVPSDSFRLNDDKTIANIFTNSMKNCEFVSGVQTNEKSGINFEFQIYSKYHQILNGDIELKMTEKIVEEKEKERENLHKIIIETPEEINNTIDDNASTSSIPKSPESVATVYTESSESLALLKSSESVKSFSTSIYSDTTETVEPLSDSPSSPHQNH